MSMDYIDLITKDIKTNLKQLLDFYKIQKNFSKKELETLSKEISQIMFDNYEEFRKILKKDMGFNSFQSFVNSSKEKYEKTFSSFWKTLNKENHSNLKEKNVKDNFVNLFIEYEFSLFKWMYDQLKNSSGGNKNEK